MKALLILILLTGCTTLGTRTMMNSQICKNDNGLDYVKIKKNNPTRARWIQEYHCVNGNVYLRPIY